MRFSLRRATSRDATVLADLHLCARGQCMSYLPHIHPPEDVRRWMRDEVLPSHEVWVAERDGVVVGFFALKGDLLGHLYVDPPFQGQGAGSALFARAQELRPNGFRLWVFQQNRQARDFYEHRGMRVVELTDGSGNEEREPDALYEWRPA